MRRTRHALLSATIAAVLTMTSSTVPVISHATASGTATGPLNVILFITDDQTLEAFQRMAYVNSRTSWVRFNNAWINNALCCPSRATILSGRYDTHTRVLNNRNGFAFDSSETIGTWLRRKGYRTGLIGKYLNGIGDPMAVPPGWDDFQAVWPNDTGYEQYGYTMNVNGRQVPYGYAPGDYEVDVLTRKARSFIARSVSLGKPFLLVFTPTATHGPFVAGPGEVGMFDQAPVPPLPGFNERDVSDKPAYVRNLPAVSADLTTEERRLQWAASVSVDKAFRALDAQLQASGAFERTVVIFLTDNGFSFGVHRLYGKMCEYKACSQTPLLIRHPAGSPRTVERYVSNVDIASTVADVADAVPGAPQDGRSLLPLVLNQAVSGWPTAVLQHWSGGDNVGRTGHGTVIPEFWAIRAQLNGRRYTYVELVTGEKELYDLAQDPHELANVANRAAYSQVQSQLATKLRVMKAGAALVHAGIDDRPTSAEPPQLYIDEYRN